MNVKVLFLLVLTMFAVVSSIATVAVAFDTSMLNSFRVTEIVNIIESKVIQPTGGDPVDDPVFPM